MKENKRKYKEGENTQNYFIDLFPNELFLQILSYIKDYREIKRMRFVCKEWNLLLQSNNFWTSIYLLRWSSIGVCEKKTKLGKSLSFS